MHRGIAPRVGAHRARILAVDIAADLADRDLLHRGLQRGGERRHQLLAPLDERERGATRRARPEPRQAGQELDQTFDFRTGDGGGHRADVFRVSRAFAVTLTSPRVREVGRDSATGDGASPRI